MQMDGQADGWTERQMDGQTHLKWLVKIEACVPKLLVGTPCLKSVNKKLSTSGL